MGGAVEAVAAQMVVGVVLGGDGIAISLRGHGHMERGVEYGNLGLARHGLLTGFDTHEVGGVVERAEGDAVADGLLAGLVDEAGGNKLVAAMEHAMADRVDLVNGLDNAVLGVNENGHDSLDGFLVSGHGNVLLHLLTGCGNLVGQPSVKANTLAKTLCGNVAGVGIHQLILQARAARVDDQNVHGRFTPVSFIIFETMIKWFCAPDGAVTIAYHTIKARGKQGLLRIFLKTEEIACEFAA